MDNVGQRVFIDNEFLGSNKHDHSNFNWKSEVRLGYSEDEGQRFQG